jgi:16S rRNA processing protein RimM
MIVLGKIIEPYGIGGWVRVHPFADDELAWSDLHQWCLSKDDTVDRDELWTPRQVEKARVSNGKVLAKLAGADDRTAAEALKGWFVGVPREQLPQPETGEYYWTDLIGMRVVNLQGDVLGVVAELLSTGANDVLVVQQEKQERLIPFLDHVIKGVQLEEKTIQVDWGADW